MAIQAFSDLQDPKSWIPRQSRLLYVVGQLGLGGLERQLYYLLENLDRARYQPSIVVWNLNPDDKYYRDIEELDIPIYGFPAVWNPLSKLKALRALARQVLPEVIHSYGFHTNFAAYYAAWGAGSLAIGSLRGDFVRARQEGGAFKGALNARWPDCHISNSRASVESTDGPFRPKRVFVVRNALDLKNFKCVSGTFTKRDYVAAVGSLLPVKRWDRLLKVARVLKTVVGDDIHFQIAGDGPLRSALEKLAGDLGISGCVKFLGAVHDIPTFLSGAKFLVHTSESEGCPNAVMEAMACGLPVVAMEAGEIPYLVEAGKTGFVVSQGDEAMFVRRVTELFSDDDLCSRMGWAAREKAQREFTLERLVLETLAVYRAAGWRDERVDNLSTASTEVKAI
ncbi:MAG: glycosyltransferase family 4 protein [Nitrospirota bacterium]|nr:glycosyltransferase family 4 protein [Nitrospirota bacterium]